MEITIGISIYLLLGVIGYVIVRRTFLLTFKTWTISHRNCHLFGILLGIIFLLFAIFIHIEAYSDDYKNKESKW